MTDSNSNTSTGTKELALLLKDLLKVIKVVSMYPESNPLPQSLRRSFAERLESIVEQQGEITIIVQEDRLLSKGDVVFLDKSKEDSLASIFFGAGITEFVFRDGLEIEEIFKLLDVIKRYMNSPDKGIDLVAAIWEAGISRFGVKSLEDIALSEYDEKFDIQEYTSSKDTSGSHRLFGTERPEDYNAIFVPLNDSGKVEFSQVEDTDPGSRQPSQATTSNRTAGSVFYAVLPDSDGSDPLAIETIDEVSLKTVEAASAMGFSDIEPTRAMMPDTTMILNDSFALSQEEEAKVRQLLEEDAQFDQYESTVELLKEMLLQESEMSSFYETVTICEKVMAEFISCSRLVEAGMILQHLQELEQKIRKSKPLWAERLKDACVTAGSRDRLKLVSAALNKNPGISAAELRRYLNHFDWLALSGISDLIGDLEHEPHRNALVEYLTLRGRDKLDVVGKGIYDKRQEVVCNAISILSRIGSDQAFKYLRKAADHKSDMVRLTLVISLKDSPGDEAIAILRDLVNDEKPQIRKEAIHSIVARRGRTALETVTSIINDENFSVIEREDQKELLKAFSILGGEEAVGYLARLAGSYNLFRNPTLSFLRQAAFEAMSVNMSEKCEHVLLAFARSWRPDLKNRAHAALRQRRENMYGGEI